MTDFILIPREETKKRYETNKKINQAIAKQLQRSLNEDHTYTPMPYKKDYDRIYHCKETHNIHYGTTTLGQGGCAIFCFHQGLRLQRNINIPIKQLAKEAGDKGYYESGQGTYHNLFDHYGLKRVSDIQEIYDTIAVKPNPVITVLIHNNSYNGKNEGHFINIVGLSNSGKFLVDDPEERSTRNIPQKVLFDSIRVAWIW